MQDDSKKLIEIFMELQRLQTYHRQIKHVKQRLQRIMEKEAVNLTGTEFEAKLPSNSYLATEFEAKLASHIHPFMYSYPGPLGDRYRDVQCLLNELADKTSEQGLKHQQYLETILPLKEKGYRYAVCNSATFSPTNSGLNIDPETFSFRASASDDCLYFSKYSDSSISLRGTSELEVETTAAAAGVPVTVAESMVCHPPSEYHGGTSLVSDLDYVSSPESLDSPPIPAFSVIDKPDSAAVRRPESLACNIPESTYQSLIRSNSTSLSSTTSSQDSADHWATTNNTTSTQLPSNTTQLPSNTTPSISDTTQFYCVPVSGLDCKTYSKYRTVTSMVVSQTWLTGWIKDLYQIESEIVKSTGSKPLK